jgi:carboxylesterase
MEASRARQQPQQFPMSIDLADKSFHRRLMGVMILHGFTANLESVRTLFQPLGGTGLQLVTPLLRGHGQESPDSLRGIRWNDWLDDAERALADAAGTEGKLVVVGHSMGALLALQLAARHPELVDSVVLATPPLRLTSLFAPGRPLNLFAPLVSRLFDRWDFQPRFAEPETAVIPVQYAWAPTGTILSMFELVEATTRILGRVRVPALILQGRNERIVLPESAGMVLDGIATLPADKSVFWLEKSDHQVFCDCEREAAVGAVAAFVARRLEAAPLSVPV